MAIYLGNTKVNATAGTPATASITVDQSYDATSTNAQSGTAVAEAIEEITVDQTYSASSTNAQSGVAVGSAIATKQNTVLYGTTAPTSADGSDGDVYILYS